MEANRDCKKEPKKRESEAEDVEEGHQIGSLSGKAFPDKAAPSFGKQPSCIYLVSMWQFRPRCHRHMSREVAFAGPRK